MNLRGRVIKVCLRCGHEENRAKHLRQMCQRLSLQSRINPAVAMCGIFYKCILYTLAFCTLYLNCCGCYSASLFLLITIQLHNSWS